jgi:hypothetical protein
MKTPFSVGLLFSIALNLTAQTGDSGSQASGSTPPQDTPYAVTQRDANSRVWERTTYEQAPDGTAYPHVHRFTEMATGMHYKDAQTDQWVESKEEIDILPDGGAVATQGQYQVYFPSDIYDGQIRMITPGGEVLRSRPLGLSYDDGTSTALISELQHSVGALVGSNQVLYTNAFTGFNADLLYTYTKSGFEQDIILREAPQTPESYGLNGATAQLQVLTEFFSPPQPAIAPSVLPPQAGMVLTDQALNFSDIEVIRGRAFLMGANAVEQPVMVGKQWLLLDDRQFLVEEVPVNAIVNGLAALPQSAMNSYAGKTPHLASRHLALPPQRLAKASPKIKMLARTALPTEGFVLDYQTLSGSLTNFTFKADMTYYISGTVSLYQTNTFEGGTVLKFTTNGSLATTSGYLVCNTGPYRPARFTSKDDNAMGETISGSSGGPATGSSTYLAVNSSANASTYKYLRFAYAGTGILAPPASSGGVWDCQFTKCGMGFAYAGTGTLNLHNVLFSGCRTNISSGGNGSVGEQLTCDGGVLTAALDSVTLTNSVLTAVTNYGTVTLDHCATNASATGVFLRAGAGNYYLANSSTNRDVGTTNISAALLAELRQKTTYPPMVYSNVTFSTNVTLSQQAIRDTDTPDLGYHYDALDYAFGGVVVNSNLTFNAGAAIGSFELPGGSGFSIRLSGVGNAQFNGLVTAPCVLARYNTVQEGGNGLWTDRGSLAFVTSASGNTAPVEADAQFTHFYGLVADPNFFAEYFEPLNLVAQNCEFSSASLVAYWMGQYFTNCLFDRVQTVGIHGNFSPEGFGMRNCTMHGGSLQITRSGGSWLAMITNCAFDGVDFSLMDATTNYTYCAYNAFLASGGRTSVTNVHDVAVSSFNWQTNWLGNYYLPNGSSLVDAGSATADLLGLYHFTTQTNQIKETNSVVDIGYHYVALDSLGNPIDTDGDGIPDYIEDANGNGLADVGESSWLLNAYNGLSSTNGLQVFTPLK